MLIAFQALLALTAVNTVETPEDQEPIPDEAVKEEQPQTLPIEALNAEMEDSEIKTATDDAEAEDTTPVPLRQGVIEHVYDFVREFESSQASNVAQVSVSMADSAGGVRKPAIFEHPRTEGDARIEYTAPLPKVEANENLMLHFCIGLRDGVDFDRPETKPNGVKFTIEVAGERRFEGVAVACQWAEYGVDITDLAGREAQIAFLTNCNGDGNANYDWALWGNPEILKLNCISPSPESGETVLKMRRGLAIALLGGEPPEILVAEFQREESTIGREIADVLSQQIAAKSGRPVEEMALYAEQPELEIAALGPSAAVVAARDDFELQCTIRNDGLAPLEPFHDASASISRIKLRRGRATQPIKTLNPGETTTLTWNIRNFSRELTTQVSVSLKYQTPIDVIRRTVETEIAVLPDQPRLPNQAASELNTYDQYGHVIAENANVRAVFVRGNQGFEYYVVFVARNARYRQVATGAPLSEVRYRDNAGNIQRRRIVPTRYQLAGNSAGESIVILSTEETDADGVKWNFEARFSLTESSRRLKVSYRLVADGDRELLAFKGPMLHAGDGAFGENKTAALFPGLEFLEGDEPSSSTRDAAPPLNNRLVPHPYKITIPLMAVEHKRTLVGLIWDGLQTWDGKHHALSAVFASPNWYEHQNNHLMGLFLPTPTEWVKENCLEADAPYLLKAGHPITLRAEIIADGNAAILDAIAHWYDAFGAPEPLEPPRDDEEELLLSRHAFMHTVWDEDTRKSRHCVGWAPANAPGFATLLWYDYLVQTQGEKVKDNAVKQRVMEIAENTIRESGKGGLVSPNLCHILRWEFPFYFGYVEEGLEQLKEMMQGVIASQEPDGGWCFHPTTDRTKTLGREGDAVLGTCAHSALTLLKHARVTGDPDSLKAGLKALKFMDRFSIPRGAQAWECPLYEPDILAAAHAVGAYIEAYEATGDRSCLERAEYWAKTGLSFLYHWHLPDRPGMRFASIPVFGTTFYTHPWFGAPVQWNGLVYAYYLQRLARRSNVERQAFWSKIAEGVLVSAMYQQWTEGELKGTYPDGFYDFCTVRKGPHINPEDIMVNLYALRGLDPDISTRVLHTPQGHIHLSTGAKIESFTQDESRRLTFTLRYVQFETSHTIIAGYGDKPSVIRVRDREIPLVESLDTVESGWLYREAKDIVFIKYRHPVGEIRFEASPPEKTEPPQEMDKQEKPETETSNESPGNENPE